MDVHSVLRCEATKHRMHIRLPDDGLRTKTCLSVFNVVMSKCYKFYICAVVDVIIE